jgi:hypothetical protein
MVTAEDKPGSRLEEAPPTQCPRCKALLKVCASTFLSLATSSLTWTTAATDAEQRSFDLCRVSAQGGWVFTSSRSWCANGPLGRDHRC